MRKKENRLVYYGDPEVGKCCPDPARCRRRLLAGHHLLCERPDHVMVQLDMQRGTMDHYTPEQLKKIEAGDGHVIFYQRNGIYKVIKKQVKVKLIK